MKTTMRLILVAVVAVTVIACETSTDRTDSGGVLLSISDFDGLPIPEKAWDGEND